MKKNWTVKVFILTFVLAIIFSLIANLLGNLNNIILIVCLFIIITIGIIFDLIGTAVLCAEEKVLHSKASQKIYGAKSTIKLVKNASSVASFCNDVVGDVCGIVSGSLATVIVMNLFKNGDLSFWNILLSSILSSITVGGKAIGKKIGIKKSNEIIHLVGRFLAFCQKEK